MSKNLIIRTIEPDALWVLCQEYDRVNGMHPGSKYEGIALFHHYHKIMQKEVKDGDLK